MSYDDICLKICKGNKDETGMRMHRNEGYYN